jgi:hypothetical protein
METYTCPVCFKYFSGNINIDKYYHKCDTLKGREDDNYLRCAVMFMDQYMCWYCRGICNDRGGIIEHMAKCGKKDQNCENVKILKIKEKLKKIEKTKEKKNYKRDDVIKKIDTLISEYLVNNINSFDYDTLDDIHKKIDHKVLENIFIMEHYPIYGLVKLIHCNRYVPENMNLYYSDGNIYVYVKDNWKKYDADLFLKQMVSIYLPELIHIMRTYELIVPKRNVVELCFAKHKMLFEETQMDEFVEGLKLVLSDNKEILEKTRKLWENAKE